MLPTRNCANYCSIQQKVALSIQQKIAPATRADLTAPQPAHNCVQPTRALLQFFAAIFRGINKHSFDLPLPRTRQTNTNLVASLWKQAFPSDTMAASNEEKIDEQLAQLAAAGVSTPAPKPATNVAEFDEEATRTHSGQRPSTQAQPPHPDGSPVLWLPKCG